MSEPAWGDPTQHVTTFDELLARVAERAYARGYEDGRRAAAKQVRAAIGVARPHTTAFPASRRRRVGRGGEGPTITAQRAGR